MHLFHAYSRVLLHQVTEPACLRDMALVDSNAAFKQRCMAVDHSGALWKGLAADQVLTFAQLAFVLGTPQSPPSQEQFDQLAGKVWETPSLGDVAKLRLLHFEASTLVVAHLKAQVSSETVSIGWSASQVAQQKRLTGVLLKGELQPSFAQLHTVDCTFQVHKA